MKTTLLLVYCVATFNFALSFRIIPENLPQPCSQSTPDYNECTMDVLNKSVPYLLRGIPELNIPSMVPLNLPVLLVNRSLGDYLSISAIAKDIKLWGLDTLQLTDFKFHLPSKIGQLRLLIPERFVSMNYAVKGRLLAINLNSKGFLEANTTNTDLFFKFKLKTTEKLGVIYFAFKDLKAKCSIGDAYLRMTSANPRYQMAADIIANFVNENPRRSLDLFRPIYQEGVAYFFKSIADQILKTVPAQELLPE